MLDNLKLDPIYDGFLFLAESARNAPRLHSHHHVELELNLVVRGAITYVVRNRRYTFTKRSLLWLFPAQEHQLVDRSDDAEYYVVVFKPALIRQACHSRLYAPLRRKGTKLEGVIQSILEPESFDLIRKTMDAMMQGSLDPDVLNREGGYGYRSNFSFRHGDPEGLNAGLRHILLLCWRAQGDGNALGEAVALHPSVRKALDLLASGHNELNLGELARHCGVSKAYLSRIFGRQIGVSLSRYRNSLRLSRFWRHFRQPEKSTMTEAAYAAGFGSYAQFYKVFAQAYGSGPRECLAS
jgi:methylphosphotriester-DNA--protein-cysteine methyltransferase